MLETVPHVVGVLEQPSQPFYRLTEARRRRRFLNILVAPLVGGKEFPSAPLQGHTRAVPNGAALGLSASPGVPKRPSAAKGVTVAAARRRMPVRLVARQGAETGRHGPIQVIVLVAVVRGGDRQHEVGRRRLLRTARLAAPDTHTRVALTFRLPHTTTRPLSLSQRPLVRSRVPLEPLRPVSGDAAALARLKVETAGPIRRRTNVRRRRVAGRVVDGDSRLLPSRQQMLMRLLQVEAPVSPGPHNEAVLSVVRLVVRPATLVVAGPPVKLQFSA